MTGDKISKGCTAIKHISEVVDVEAYNKIEKDLEILTDIMQEAFMDTIKLDEVNERIKSMNEQLSRHLDRLSAK